MAHRDFAARRGFSKKKKKTNKNMLIGIALVVLLAFGVGLYFLKSKTSVSAPVAKPAEKTQPKSVLPNRLEEVWSYIKALETRTVPVDDKPASVEKNMRLTEEQRQVLAQMEKDQKAAEEARKLAEQRKAEEEAKAQKATETAKVEKSQQEVKKPAETVKKTEVVKAPELAKVESAKKAETKPAETKPAETKATAESAANGKRFGLQCGAFKNRSQAENLQGRLAMSGINAQVMVNGEWNRVRVGPFASRDAANQSLEKAKSITGCVIIGM